MADKTKIEWTDATWQIVSGCSVVSPGCTNCYAMRLAGTRLQHHPSRAGLTQMSKSGPVWNGEVRFNEQWLTQPLKWAKPRNIFVAAHGDLFHESVPDEWIDKVFAVMALTPRHSYQVLTKRAERMRTYFNGPYPNGDGVMARIADATFALCPQGKLPSDFPGAERGIGPNGVPEFGWRRFLNIGPLRNVWLGVSVEDQKRADERIPHLLETPAAVRFISAEPLLGEVDLTAIPMRKISQNVTILGNALLGHDGTGNAINRLDWVIDGGESGPGARPTNPQWFRDLRDQCEASGTAYFHKQNGEFASVSEVEGEGRHHTFEDGRTVRKVGKTKAGRLLDGRTHDEMPAGRGGEA